MKKVIGIDPSSAEKEKLSILLVENDASMREIARIFLKNEYNLDSVVTGEESIEKAKEKEYDIILMDINLGKSISGLVAAQEIRKIQGYENIPIVALTAFVFQGDKEEFLSKGCTHYLGKPFRRDDLLDLIKEVLGSRKLAVGNSH